MKMKVFQIVTLLQTLWLSSIVCVPKNHEQVHISLGNDETEMLVTWSTLISAHREEPRVLWGEKGNQLARISWAERDQFQEGGLDLYVYRAMLRGLKPSTVYEYFVGDASNTSRVFSFKTLPTGNEWLPRFALYGDLDSVNGRSLPFLRQDVAKSMYDVIFHVGDFAYNLDDDNGTRGNDFMNSIEEVAAAVPYMTCSGNHEAHNNFSHYDARFSMLADRQQPEVLLPIKDRLNNHYHSMDIGPAHVVMFSTEFYYFPEHYSVENVRIQYEWLEKNLKEAHQNRQVRPWIFVMAHRPMYCFKNDTRCNLKTMERVELRQGVLVDGTRKYGLEDLFHKYGVDLQFYGHDHYYTRTLPLYNFETKVGNITEYMDPKAPIHILTGSAGNRYEHAKFNPLIDTVNFVGYHTPDYGYTRLTFTDRLKLKLEQISDDQGGVVVDSIEIQKSQDLPMWLV